MNVLLRILFWVVAASVILGGCFPIGWLATAIYGPGESADLLAMAIGAVWGLAMSFVSLMVWEKFRWEGWL